MRPWLNWIEYLTTDQKVGGSNPPGRTFFPSKGILPMLNLEPEHTDEYYMKMALDEAIKAYDRKEVPVGAVIVHQSKVVARAHNQVELLKDATAHAEMLAITQAEEALQSWRLTETTLYVTLEPCPMCAGAIQLARIPRLVFGALDPKKGACGSLMNLPSDTRFNHTTQITNGILADDSQALLKDFFTKLRKT